MARPCQTLIMELRIGLQLNHSEKQYLLFCLSLIVSFVPLWLVHLLCDTLCKCKLNHRHREGQIIPIPSSCFRRLRSLLHFGVRV